MRRISLFGVIAALLTAFASNGAVPQRFPTVTVDAAWDREVRISVTTPTTQHLANSMTVPGHPLKNLLLTDLRNLHTDATRLQLWFSVPRQVVAELNEPSPTETFWDFTQIDPVVADYFANTLGRHNVNAGTIPRWMFNVSPLDVPADPGKAFYRYVEGTRGELLKDPTGKQFGEYQARIFSWYTQGGFTDELGRFHRSNHHFKIDYWGVMNEPTVENGLTAAQYTRLYDATVIAIRRIHPKVQFIGPEYGGGPASDDMRQMLSWERYFLDPKNHDPAALPIRWFSFHNYPIAFNDPHTWQQAYFLGKTGAIGAPVRALPNLLRKVAQIRDELSPQTQIALDEVGTFLLLKPFDVSHMDAEHNPGTPSDPYGSYNPLYWVAAGSAWAGDFIVAERLGIPIISMTQMVGAPEQCESVSMINWETGAPNAHYWTLALINRHFAPGDRLVETSSDSDDVIAQASITPLGKKLLLVNSSNRTIIVDLREAFGKGPITSEIVDEKTGEMSPRVDRSQSAAVRLAPFAIAVVVSARARPQPAAR